VDVRAIETGLPLYPEEEAYMQRAVPRRRDEFATGRWCIRQALAELHVAPGPIAVGPWRNPVWPEQLTGSISHSTHICAAVVAPRTAWKAIGIDLLDRESAAHLPVDAGRLLAHPHDSETPPPALPAWVPPLVLLFSAKESAIKALSPGLQRFVDFPEIYVRFESHSFIASMDGAKTSVRGWWTTVMDEMVVTGAVVI
jgi:4'-phosphopantetheinyl transferase EntD